MSDDNGSLRGAYGLTFRGLATQESVHTHLVAAGDDWPVWEFCWKSTGVEAPSVVESWSTDRAILATQPEGRVTIERALARTTLHLPSPPSSAAILHPYLASTGVVAGQWLGRSPFHAGAFEFDGRAWGVLGGREMGKSSLLMCLQRADIPILADDLLVLSGDTAYAGPRCLDLRESAARHFQEGDYLASVGTRDRWRVSLPSVPPELPFGGWVQLAWSKTVQLERPTVSDRLAALAAHRGLTAAGAPPGGLLEWLDFPMVLFARPRDWTQAESATSQLLDALRTVTGVTGDRQERASPVIVKPG